jgi:hypothetical protein
LRDVRFNGRRDPDPTIIESAPSVLSEAPYSAVYALPVRDLLHVIRQRIWVIALAVVFLTGMAVGLGAFSKRPYTRLRSR